MKKMSKKTLSIYLHKPLNTIPNSLSNYKLLLTDKGKTIIYSYNISHERTGITSLLSDLSKEQIVLKDIQTKQSSLEDIFVNIVKE